MKIYSYNPGKPAFKAEVAISDKNGLLNSVDIENIKEAAKITGQPDDLISIDLNSEIIDSVEINRDKSPKKFLTGYKLKFETTLKGAESFDASVSKTQQCFWEKFGQYNPAQVIQSIINAVSDATKLQALRQDINDNPEIYNSLNENWQKNASIETPDIESSAVLYYLHNSPFYKAMIEEIASHGAGRHSKKAAVIDVFKTNGLSVSDSQKYDEAHGNLVFSVLKQLTKNSGVEIDTYNVIAQKNRPCSFNPKSLLKTLKKIKDKNYDYINLSVYYPADYTAGGKAFSPDELYKYRETLLEEIPKVYLHIIEELEDIIESGTQVYIAGGNKDTKYNILSLTRGAHIIGGEDTNPLKKFSKNSMIEDYESLPVYIGTAENSKPGNLTINYPFEKDFSKLSKRELIKRIATKKDYIELENAVNDIYEKSGRQKFDMNYLQYKVAFSVNKNLRRKIYEIEKLRKIFENKLDSDVLENTFPAGTHCDLQLNQFFDMNSKKNYIIPRKRTTKILKSISGSSFAVPQALARQIYYEKEADNFVRKNAKYIRTVFDDIFHKNQQQ